MTFTGEYRGGEGHGHEHNEDPHSAVAAHTPAISAKVHASDGAVHAHGTGHAARTAHDAAHGGHDDHGHGAHAAASHDAHDDHDDAHGGHHGGTPHESPWQITIVLATLAAGSVLTLFLGIPMLWTHAEPILEHWLAPVLLAEVSWPHHPHAMEWLFQGLGVAAATIGFVAARAVYKDNKNEAALLAMIERWKGVWTTVYNKYYVDELYAWLVLKPTSQVARALSWFDGKILDGIVNAAGLLTKGFANIDGALDKYLVDGAVNGLAEVVQGAGRSLRRVQTGRIQTYLYGALGGALVVVLVNFLLP